MAIGDKDSLLAGPLWTMLEVDLLQALRCAQGAVEPPSPKGSTFFSELPLNNLSPQDLYLEGAEAKTAFVAVQKNWNRENASLKYKCYQRTLADTKQEQPVPSTSE